MVELNSSFILNKILPRILKATVWGSLTILVVYYLPTILLSTDFIPVDYANTLLDFTLISVFFVVVGQLFAGTIIGCGFGIARAIVIMVYFFMVSGGGVFSVILPISDAVINFTFDISVIFLMIVSVSLFDIAKNLLEAITILFKKTNNRVKTSISFY